MGYSRGVVRNGWKLIRMVGPRNLTADDSGRCHSVQGEILDPTLGAWNPHPHPNPNPNPNPPSPSF